MATQLVNGNLKYPKDNGYLEKTATTKLGWRIYLADDGKPISIINQHVFRDLTGTKVFCQPATFTVSGVNKDNKDQLFFLPISGANYSSEDSQVEGIWGGGSSNRYLTPKYGYTGYDLTYSRNREFEPILFTIYKWNNRFSTSGSANYDWTEYCYGSVYPAVTYPPTLPVKSGPSGSTTPYTIYDSTYHLTVCANFKIGNTTYFLRATEYTGNSTGYGNHTTRGYLNGSYGYKTMSDFDSTIYLYQAINQSTIGYYLMGTSGNNYYGFALVCTNNTKPTSMAKLGNGTYYYLGTYAGQYLFPSTWTGVTISKKHDNINYYVHQVNGSWVTDFTIPNHDYIVGENLRLYNSGFAYEYSRNYTMIILDSNTVRTNDAFDNNRTEHSGTPANSYQYVMTSAGTASMSFRTIDGYLGVLSRWL